eukprot:152563-Pleurochrysis_carterae.AAC.1
MHLMYLYKLKAVSPVRQPRRQCAPAEGSMVASSLIMATASQRTHLGARLMSPLVLLVSLSFADEVLALQPARGPVGPNSARTPAAASTPMASASLSVETPSAAAAPFDMEAFDKAVMNTYGRFKLAISHGEGCSLFDTEGKRYLDFAAGIAT